MRLAILKYTNFSEITRSTVSVQLLPNMTDDSVRVILSMTDDSVPVILSMTDDNVPVILSMTDNCVSLLYWGNSVSHERHHC